LGFSHGAQKDAIRLRHESNISLAMLERRETMRRKRPERQHKLSFLIIFFLFAPAKGDTERRETLSCVWLDFDLLSVVGAVEAIRATN
jgi:hypothetical protein